MWIDGNTAEWLVWIPLVLNMLIVIALIGLAVIFIKKYIKKVIQKELQMQNDNTEQNSESS